MWAQQRSPRSVVWYVIRTSLSAGASALHQALTGDRLRLALDAPLSREVTGNAAPAATTPTPSCTAPTAASGSPPAS
jgi:hypothetical protein